MPLALRWPPRQRFEHFRCAAGDAPTLAAVQALATAPSAPWVLFSGPPGSGKTHLLIAACQAAQAVGRRAQYLNAARLLADANALRALGGAELLALDDVHALAGNRDAEHALFDLYNRLRAEQASLLLAAAQPLPALALGLADLRSRLGACVQSTLSALDETARRALMQEWAGARGLQVEPAVLDWLFARAARDLGSLHALFERMDRAALAERRRITIPFLRTLLAGRD
ncbi:DnaA regulatory inactivator Hda [mine drainage metagenome]|uniref:DnaA regulatory inactivator Hda n=1 Tax=mine drainage metagenome TaxID=410659 RepID=T1BZ10_9ZZZZ